MFVVLHYAYGYGWQLGFLAAALVFGLVFLRTRSIVAAIALHALSNLWVVLNWQVRATYGDAAILGWLCWRPDPGDRPPDTACVDRGCQRASKTRPRGDMSDASNVAPGSWTSAAGRTSFRNGMPYIADKCGGELDAAPLSTLRGASEGEDAERKGQKSSARPEKNRAHAQKKVRPSILIRSTASEVHPASRGGPSVSLSPDKVMPCPWPLVNMEFVHGNSGIPMTGPMGQRKRYVMIQKPGEKPNKPGVHVERGPRGGEVPHPRKVNIEPGDTPLPPTSESRRTWERVGPPK